MCSKVLIFLALVAVAFAADELTKEEEEDTKILLECGNKFGLEEKDYEYIQKMDHNPPKKVLCCVKCFAEGKGIINKKGELNVEIIDELMFLAKHKDEDRAKINACLKKTGPVKTCEDMAPLMKCASEMKQ